MKRLVPYLLVLGLSTQLDLDFCHQQLGAAVGGGLEDSAFSASSSYDEASVGPRNARLNGDGNGGAWCSATPVSREMGSKEWIEVDLGSMHVITAVWTQGRFGNGRGAEFTEAYKLQYWRPSMTDFVEYRDSMGRTVLPGNENTYTVVNNTLQPPILAWKIRLLPFSEHPRTPCVRLEYVGCPLTEGVVSYSIPQGMVRGSFELMDHTYDGKEDSRTGELRGGLGQLVDGRYGYDNFKTGKGAGSGYLKGYDWIGWKRKGNQASVNLLFAFDSVRTFQRVDLHVDNHFSKDIQVFKQAKLYFSNEEDKFGDDRGLTFNYMPDLAIEKKRNVSINLKGEHGKYIMLQLYFNAKWILISEVTFFSQPRQEKPFRVTPDSKEATQTQSKNEPGPAHHRPSAPAAPAEEVEVAPIDIDIQSFEAADPDGRRKDRGDASSPRPHSDSIGLVIGSLLTVILLLLMGILLMVHRSRVSKEKRATPTHSLLTASSKPHPDRFNLSLSAAAPVSDQVIHYTPYSHLNGGGSKSYEETIYEEPFNVVPRYLSTDDLTDEYAEPGVHLSHSLSENIYSQAINNGPTQSTRKGHLPPLPLSHYARPGSPPPLELPPPPPPTYESVLVNRHSKRDRYHHPPSPRSHSGSSSSSNTPHGRYPPLTTLSSSRRRSSRSSRNSSTLKKNESIDLSKLYAQVEKTNAHEKLHPFKRSTSIDTVNVKLSELDMSHLEIVEQLGEGQFGEIHLCRYRNPLPPAHDRDREKTSTEESMVAVKFLRPDCDEMTRSDFEHEARILTSLSDVNLVRVMGVGYRSDAPEELEAMVCEYTSLGDLCQFLDAHVAETTLSKSPNVPTLSYGSLIYMATQIASGMTYLESLNFVHRDLAARNCIVGPRKSVKICDLGMSRPMYKDDYYKTESGCQLPIRWMSWESVLLGKFTTKSDVWSFGVTLWEILTFAREQPYESQSDAKVLSNLSNMWRDGRPSLVLSSPRGCSREVRDLMIECWQKAEDERPTFQEIHLFLQRKNLGYEPQ